MRGKGRGLVKSAEMAELKNYTMEALEFCFEIRIYFFLPDAFCCVKGTTI